MRPIPLIVALLFCSSASAQTPDTPSSEPTPPSEAATNCESTWQTAQAAGDRARQLAGIKRWKEAGALYDESLHGIRKVIADCPSHSKAAESLYGPLSQDAQRAEGAIVHQRDCEPSIDKAFAADIRASTGRRENLDPKGMEPLLADAESAWQAAVNSCASPNKEKFERNLKVAQKARAENAELLSGGPACESAWRNAGAMTEIARDARKAKRWDEAAMQYTKAHMAWERVAENCTGSRQQTANAKVNDMLVDAHNAEYCGPQWDEASDLLSQYNKAKTSSAPFAERDLLMTRSEVAWREAVNLCRGDSKNQAKNTADALARERGAPLPPNAMTQHGKNRQIPPEPVATAAPTAKPATITPPLPKAAVAPPAASSVATVAAPAKPVQEAITPSVKSDSAPQKPIEPGVMQAGDTTYRGNFTLTDGKVSGDGVVEWANGDKFQGTLIEGAREGKGRFTWRNGQWYEGDWKTNIANGKGVIFYTNGNRYEGHVSNGIPDGNGTLVFISGDRYTGHFKQGVFHGKGSYHWKSGSVYVGDWVLGQKHGIGRMTMPDGSGWEGEYINDEETDKVTRFKS